MTVESICDVYRACKDYEYAAIEVDRAVRAAYGRDCEDKTLELALLLGWDHEDLCDWLQGIDSLIVPHDPYRAETLRYIGDAISSLRWTPPASSASDG